MKEVTGLEMVILLNLMTGEGSFEELTIFVFMDSESTLKLFAG